jgi:hypothetical protein
MTGLTLNLNGGYYEKQINISEFDLEIISSAFRSIKTGLKTPLSIIGPRPLT